MFAPHKALQHRGKISFFTVKYGLLFFFMFNGKKILALQVPKMVNVTQSFLI